MSVRRVTAAGALLVWRVAGTRCPVSAASTLVLAVSRFLISPIITTSGSERKMLLSPEWTVRPVLGLTWTWLMPRILYSTGSSTVTMFFAVALSSPRVASSVVDLPEPIGPVTSIVP